MASTFLLGENVIWREHSRDLMWYLRRTFSLLAMLLSTAVLATLPLAAQRPSTIGRVIFDSVSSAALRHNRVGDRGVRSVVVYVPLGYDREPTRRYPTVYLLHGGRMSDSAWIGHGGNGYYHEWPDSTRPLSIAAIMDSLVRAGAVRPMIIVMPDVRDRYDGSWYTNSPVVGRWEDYITHDLIAHVDSTYRTIPEASSRGIAGHSLGGFGAIKLAMTHTDLYGAVFAMSPCCLALTDEFSFTDPSWQQTLEMARAGDPNRFQSDRGPFNWGHYTAALAFSPDTSAGPLFVAWPVTMTNAGLVPVDSVVRRWTSQTPAAMVRNYAVALRKMRGIHLENGTREPLANLRLAARALSDSLSVLGIPHVYAVFDGGHEDHIAQRLREALLPFFSSVLASDGGAYASGGAAAPDSGDLCKTLPLPPRAR